LPSLFWIELSPVFLEPSDAPFEVVVDFNGLAIARLPFVVRFIANLPSFL
jgi:hypothetical protein